MLGLDGVVVWFLDVLIDVVNLWVIGFVVYIDGIDGVIEVVSLLVFVFVWFDMVLII